MDGASVRETAGEVSDMLEDWAERYGIAFSPSCNLTGGEPLLREDLFEVLGMLRKHGFEVYLLTNGTLIDRERARCLAALTSGIQVSL